MLVILTSRQDADAQALVTRWAEHGTSILSAEDLSCCGWCFDPDVPSASLAVIDNSIVRSDSITTVLIRRPAIFAEELVTIAAAERDYVASEMNALLYAWLRSLQCPVINAPTPGCLAGPAWTDYQWQFHAAWAGMQIRPKTFCAPQPEQRGIDIAPATREVTAVAQRVVGASSRAEETALLKLMSAAQLSYLSARFEDTVDGPVFLSADICPRLDNPVVSDLLLKTLLQGKHPAANCQVQSA